MCGWRLVLSAPIVESSVNLREAEKVGIKAR